MKLEVKDLNISFGSTKILDDVNFHVSEGEFVAILGPSGCGKSTILKVLAGVLKNQETSVFVDGEKVNGKLNHFAYMPQDDLLLEWKTIIDNVTLYSKIHGNQKETKQKALKEFETFGLKGYENAYPESLSGGMRQRAAFLRTALCDADILLLDEPFGALDVITRNDMQDWLLTLRKELNRTMILVTHDIEEAIYLADRILILKGRPASIQEEITFDEVSKSREWLYEQGDLKNKIYRLLKGENHVD